MLKKILVIFAILLFVVACGKSDTPESVAEEVLTMGEGFAKDMNGANSADDVAEILNEYADKVEKAAPRWKAVMEKHPELKGMNPSSMPESLKKYEERFKAMTMTIMGAAMKMGMHGKDPKVMEASKRFKKIGELFK